MFPILSTYEENGWKTTFLGLFTLRTHRREAIGPFKRHKISRDLCKTRLKALPVIAKPARKLTAIACISLK